MQSNSSRVAVADMLAPLLDIAQDVFGRRVTGEDNFFALGGDSISAVRIVMRLEDLVGTDIDPDMFFDAANFEEVARALSGA